MTGITAYGVCLPYYRIKRKTIYEAMGWFNPGLAALASGEKTVANHDEDSLTLAVAAGIDCFDVIDRDHISTLFLASSSLPYLERSSAAIAAEALNLSNDTRTSEFSGTPRAGTSGLISALNETGPGVKMICAVDCRLGKSGGTSEQHFGDAAAAVTVGTEGVVASYGGSHSIFGDFADVRRTSGDRFVRTWEERWIREEGYFKFIPDAINGLLAKSGISMKDLAKVVFPPWAARDHAVLARKMGLEARQVQDHLLGQVGNSGSAHPLLMLAAALDEASPGDRIVVSGYGSGADAILFTVTDAILGLKKRNKFHSNLSRGLELDSYLKYLSFKGMIDKEAGIRGEEIAVTSLSLTWRERKAVLRLTGGKCIACGTPQFPRETMCINPDCGAVDQLEDYPFSDKSGRLFTYTADHLAYSEDPPSLYGIIDFEGGGRYWFDLTDCKLEALKVSQPMRMTFRRKYQDKDRSIYGYSWKAMPLKA